jgi:hypothetical protein
VERVVLKSNVSEFVTGISLGESDWDPTFGAASGGADPRSSRLQVSRLESQNGLVSAPTATVRQLGTSPLGASERHIARAQPLIDRGHGF